jgi:flagellar motility protein MotE (MotC chaperone)
VGRRREQQEAARGKAREQRDRAIAAAEAELEDAERAHQAKVQEIDKARTALDRKLEAEAARWRKKKEQLEIALRQTRSPRLFASYSGQSLHLNIDGSGGNED